MWVKNRRADEKRGSRTLPALRVTAVVLVFCDWFFKAWDRCLRTKHSKKEVTYSYWSHLRVQWLIRATALQRLLEFLSEDCRNIYETKCIGYGVGRSQLATVFQSLLWSPNSGKWSWTLIPLLSFLASKSHLLRNRTNWTVDSNLLLQTAFHRRRLSVTRFTRRSSLRFSSKQEIGATKMMALQSSKYGNQAAR